MYPGVVQGCKPCRGAGLPLACLTNKPLAFAQPLLQAKGLDGFLHACLAATASSAKARPAALVKTCEALGTSARAR